MTGTPRPLWFLERGGGVVRANGKPPKDAGWFCHEGDSEWTPMDAAIEIHARTGKELKP
jgi:hypothetical protein